MTSKYEVCKSWKLEIYVELEDTQLSLTKTIDRIGLPSYSDRRKNLRLTALLERRMRGDLMETLEIDSEQADYGKNFLD